MFSKISRFFQKISFKSLFGTVLIIIIFAAVVSSLGYQTFTNAMLEQYAESAFRTAETAATMLNADRIVSYLSEGDSSEQYRLDRQQLRQICNATNSAFIYVICPDVTDFWHITFVISTVNKDLDFPVFEFGYVRETTNQDYNTKYKALYDGSSSKEYVVRDRGYIPTDKHITAMLPLIGSDGETKAILCVQYQLDVLEAARTSFVLKVLMFMGIILIIVILIQMLYLSRLLLRPLKNITQEASRFADENVLPDKKLSEVVRNKDEIGILAGSIDHMEEQIKLYVDNLTRATAEKERIQTELTLATRIQANMLPNIFPAFPDRKEFDLYAIMDPAREVGGDFFDYFLVDDDHLCLLIADVSGKGIPAALFMMVSMIILRNNAKMKKTPAEILGDVNEMICSNNKEDMFVSVWLGILEISTGKLTAANAGHEYPALFRPDGAFEILKDKHGLVIGAMPGLEYKEYELNLEAGSRIFVYTDGVPEATAEDKTMFGLDRLIDALNKDPRVSPQQILLNVRESVDDFVKDAEQFDDLTMLCLEYKGPEPEYSDPEVKPV